MDIQIDSREHKSQLNRIMSQFDALGVRYLVSKLPCGDYMSLDNARLVIDRKQNLTELCSNVCQDHERFRAEITRANDMGIHLIFLCEHGDGIESLEDVIFWENPRRKRRIKKNGKWQTIETKATTGDVLYRILKTIERKYGVEFLFRRKEDTGATIVELFKERGSA